MEIKQQIIKLRPRIFIKVRKSNGNLRIDEEVPCHSYVKNFYLLILQQLLGPNARSSDSITIKDTLNNSRNSNTRDMVGFPSSNSYFSGGTSDSDYGIVVGNDDTAWDVDDYILGNQLTEGIGAGYLSHGAQSSPVVSDVDDTRTITINRSFYNNDPTGITVKEVGWYLSNCYNGSSYGDIVMIFRDVLDTPITLSESEELNVEFAIDLVYPETIS